MVGTNGFCRLFLDELPEFGTRVLEVLRQPLEDKTVSIARNTGTLNFPANFMLIGAANLCPQGFYRLIRYREGSSFPEELSVRQIQPRFRATRNRSLAFEIEMF